MAELGSLYVTLGLDSAQFDRALPQTVDKLKVVEKATGNLSFAVKNLGFQLGDVATGLLSGQSPFRILVQQGDQIRMAFSQGGGVGRVLGEFAKNLRGMVTPTTALVAGVTALGAGFGFLLSRAQSNTEQLRQYNLLLERTGRLSSNIDIGGENTRLRSLGISRDLANSQRFAIARSPTANEAASERIQTLGANIGAVTGLGADAATAQLIQTIAAGPEATIRYAVGLRALSTQQAASLISSAQLTGGLNEQNKALVTLEAKFKGFAKDAMDPLKSATNELASAWENLITKMSETSFVENNRKFLAQQLNEISDFVSGKTTITGPDKLPNSPRRSVFGGGFGAQGNRLGSADPAFGGALDRPSSANTQWTMTPSSVSVADNEFETPLTFPASRMWRSASQISAGGFRLNLGGADGAVGPMANRDPQKAIDVGVAIQKQRREIAESIPVLKLWNVEQEAAAAALAKRNEMLAMGATPQEADTAAAAAATAARQKHNIELGKEVTLQDMRTASLVKVAEALKGGEAAALRVQSVEEGRIQALQRGGNPDQIAQRILAERGAQRTGDFQRAINDNQRSVQLVELETSLLGRGSDELTRQVDLLRAKQVLEERGEALTSNIAQNYLKSVEALSETKNRLADQQRTLEQFREIGSTFENSFSRAFDTIADGTFKLGTAIKGLAQDLLKTVASQAFKSLIGGDSSGGGFAGMLFGSLGGSGKGGLFGSQGALFGTAADRSIAAGGPPLAIPGFATGGSFRVGGSGGIDSQLVRFRANPGEMVNVSNDNRVGGYGGEPIRIELMHDEAFMAGVADQRIVTRSGQIVEVAVRQSQRATQRNFGEYSAATQARRL